MWLVYDVECMSTPLCYCLTKHMAQLVQEGISQIDTKIVCDDTVHLEYDEPDDEGDV